MAITIERYKAVEFILKDLGNSDLLYLYFYARHKIRDYKAMGQYVLNGHENNIEKLTKLGEFLTDYIYKFNGPYAAELIDNETSYSVNKLFDSLNHEVYFYLADYILKKADTFIEEREITLARTIRDIAVVIVEICQDENW